MIIREFLLWVRTAPAAERADALAALARAYLHSGLDADDKEAAEAAMTVLLDDPSPLVRGALSGALASSPHAPRHILLALVGDQHEVAGPILRRSPLLLDSELIDAAARGDVRIEVAVAERRPLSRAVAAALGEVGSATAVLALLSNDSADLAQFTLSRIAERHGAEASVREALLDRSDITSTVRQRLARHLATELDGLLGATGWLNSERARAVTCEAVERTAVLLSHGGARKDVAELVEHLLEERELTPALLLRSLCAGGLELFEETLVRLSGVDRRRVAALCVDGPSAGFDALYRRAGLPDAALPAFRAALSVRKEAMVDDSPGARAQFSRRMLERVLTRYELDAPDESDHLMLMLRRFASEAARLEARAFAAAYTADAPGENAA